MTSVCRDIFKAIHEEKWMAIEYHNKKQDTTKYWIGIKAIYIQERKLMVDGLHLGMLSLKKFPIHIDAIRSSTVLDGTYYETEQNLRDDLSRNPEKYKTEPFPKNWTANALKNGMNHRFTRIYATAEEWSASAYSLGDLQPMAECGLKTL